MKPGVYQDISNEAYHAGPGVSKSMLDRLARSPAHLKYASTPKTDAMDFGTAAHCAILEPEDFEERFYRGEDCRRGSKAWTALEAQAEGRAILKPDDWERIMHMRDAVYAHPSAGELFQFGVAEASVYWHDEETRLLCRARPDYLRLDQEAIIDLKTSVEASSRAFSRDCGKYRYFVQDAMYRDGVLHATGLEITTFVFVVVEKESPFAVGLYELTPQAVKRGREVYQHDLRKYAYCEKYDHWPAYSELIEEIDIPSYCYND